ncbi:type IV pilus biogenesis/stability protein PilW [Marinobacter sp. M216]|uniref:Type IV pilus biogenesis/stability protein PilW n=1 Tax=Marinobacter albus TaxID=3030833 RepID=A0ABT7HCS4_9GAMM|nr:MULTISPECIES: type IV pilus biogenesis/stability protein PilW [unclassified Marinobacter]MBW7469608.1 type IV pilus biogenesis/stability protein PilW [Marinobacter sp. F4218]MDK9558123.1 type IV pilus biogenesis/stability protein PilW [Marinobacter sp. M216]
MLAALFVTGCVTTTDSRFSREADRQEAVEDYVQLATAYIGQGNLDRARHHLDRALDLDADSPAAKAAMGLVYNAEGEAELAESSFKQAIATDQGYTRARVYYGAFLYGQGRIEEARDQFRAASRDTEYKERGSVFFNLGMTQERLDELDNAANSYRRAVELSRGDARSLLALSRVLADQGDYDAAARYYTRLASMMQRNDRLRHSPESLLTGIRIARHLDNRNQEASLALQLKNNFPESVEYQQYKVLISND